MTERQHATWGELLQEAVEMPGRMLGAYTAFHNYSFGNALLALGQCIRRNLRTGPLNTYNGWLERKRQVRKGEQGITLCIPMPFKRAAQTDTYHGHFVELVLNQRATEIDEFETENSGLCGEMRITIADIAGMWQNGAPSVPCESGIEILAHLC